MHGLEPHAAAAGLEAEQPERRDHARDASEQQSRPRSRISALEIPGARDEIDLLHEPAWLVHGEDDDAAAERDDVIGAATAREPHFRPVVAADRARVEVAVAIDLRAADEADVEKASLCQHEDV